MSRILVAFATRAGSTGEVAAAIAQTLEECGDSVALRPARDVREPVPGWDGVVLGAPIYSGSWNRHAHRFLKRHRREQGVPVAILGREHAPEEGAS